MFLAKGAILRKCLMENFIFWPVELVTLVESFSLTERDLEVTWIKLALKILEKLTKKYLLQGIIVSAVAVYWSGTVLK